MAFGTSFMACMMITALPGAREAGVGELEIMFIGSVGGDCEYGNHDLKVDTLP